MNSRERLLNCINHKPIDRVPISTYEMVAHKKDDFYNTMPSYKNMMQLFRDKTDCIYSTGAMNKSVNDYKEVTEEIHKDHKIIKTIMHLKGGDLVKFQKRYNNVNTNWTTKHYLEDLNDLKLYVDNLDYMINDVSIAHAHEIEKELGDNGIVMISVSDPVCIIADGFDFSKFLIYAIEEPKLIYRACDAVFEYQNYHHDQIIKQGIDNMMLRMCGPEYATPPYLSPKMFPNLVTKYIKHYCSEFKNANAFPRVHCHGKIKDALEEFMKTDMMALEPIEPIPDGDISLGDVKKRCGDKVCLLGNIELKDLENSNPKRIDELVKSMMEQAKGDTGFVIMPTASPINEPLSKKCEENYNQFVLSSLKYGKY